MESSHTPDRIVSYLKEHGAQTPYQLAAALQCHRMTIYRNLELLRSQGKVRRRERPYGAPGRPPSDWEIVETSAVPA